MTYIFNPKFNGSGIIGCIPQTGRCPNKCEDCFFQSNRSYLEPLDKNLPNMPSITDSYDRIVRVNDGNDSNVNRKLVMESVRGYSDVFYNTAIPKDLEGFDAPVVLTLNPGKMTDISWHKVEPISKNLMMVRFRINTWNLEIADEAIKYYTEHDIPVILTFMAYYDEKSIPEGSGPIAYMKMNEDGVYSHVCRNHKDHYINRKRTLNNYFAISTASWRKVMERYQDNPLVYSCGKEGEKGKSGCKYCGNCLREYFSCMEKLRN